MIITLRPIKDPKSYSLCGLHVAGRRFTDECDQEDVIEQYLELHLGADPATVRQQFADEMARYR